ASFINDKAGINTGVFIKMKKYKFILRPGVIYQSIHIEELKLDYLNLPVDFGYNFQNVVVEGFHVEFRALISPYYGFLLNDKKI
ncbi:MAG: hypothetical protein AAGI07_17905, partial [Bacteroidota bacterium]